MELGDILREERNEQTEAAVSETASALAKIRDEFIAHGFSREIAEALVLELLKKANQ